jgi:hypothetical protein
VVSQSLKISEICGISLSVAKSRASRVPSAFIGGLFDFGFSNVKEFGCGSATLWALRALFDRKETFTLSLIWTVASGK